MDNVQIVVSQALAIPEGTIEVKVIEPCTLGYRYRAGLDNETPSVIRHRAGLNLSIRAQERPITNYILSSRLAL